MDSASIAAAAVAANHAKVQMALAAKIAKMNHDSQASVVDLLEAASQNLETIAASAPPGLGKVVDISA